MGNFQASAFYGFPINFCTKKSIFRARMRRTPGWHPRPENVAGLRCLRFPINFCTKKSIFRARIVRTRDSTPDLEKLQGSTFYSFLISLRQQSVSPVPGLTPIHRIHVGTESYTDTPHSRIQCVNTPIHRIAYACRRNSVYRRQSAYPRNSEFR